MDFTSVSEINFILYVYMQENSEQCPRWHPIFMVHGELVSQLIYVFCSFLFCQKNFVSAMEVSHQSSVNSWIIFYVH